MDSSDNVLHKPETPQSQELPTKLLHRAHPHGPHKFIIGKMMLPLLLSLFLATLQGAAADNSQPSPAGDLAPVELVVQDVEGAPDPQQTTGSESGQTQPTPSAALSAIPPISTSRPSFTDAVTTVPQGSLQAESGATYTDNRGGTYTWNLPETLLRLGITGNTELRYTVPNYLYTGDKQPGFLTNNFGDTSVGLSHHLNLPGKVDMALIPILNLPTGAANVSSNALDPELRVVLGKAWTPKWLMSGHLDTRWMSGRDASSDVVLNPTFINYYNFTKRLTGFLEYAGFYPTQGATTQYLQSGALFLLTARQQLDARIAVGLNRNSPNILVGFGYSFRFDGLFGESRNYATLQPMRQVQP